MLTESALTHTHTHANLATLAFIRAAAPGPWLSGLALSPSFDGRLQTAARPAGENDLMKTLTA